MSCIRLPHVVLVDLPVCTVRQHITLGRAFVTATYSPHSAAVEASSTRSPSAALVPTDGFEITTPMLLPERRRRTWSASASRC